jgi:ElaB/YqjD/DUF883 family membrane-anchored ribosome-binding protein
MNARDRIQSESRKSPAQLELEIDEHRRRIEATVAVLESKLSPQHLWDQVLSHGTEGGREFASRLGETVKTHPVPAVLTAVGLAWLYAGDRQAQAHDHARMQAHASGSSDRLGTMKDRVSDSAHGAMDSARDGVQSVKHQAHRASEGFQHMLETNPLPLGAMGIAVGALLGAMIPNTHQEDELMGEASDRFAGRAKDTMREASDKAHEKLQDAGGSHADASPSGRRSAPGRPSDFATPPGTVDTPRPPRRDHH